MIAEHSPDQVVIPTADGMATMAGAPFLASIENRRTPIHVGLMIGRRPSSELTRSRRLFNEVKWRSIRRAPFRHVVLMDPRAWSELEAADELLLGPDPVPALGERHREEARRQLGLDPNSKWVVSAGNQDERKGVPELIKGFCHIDRPPSHRLLLIGKCSAAVQSVLSDVSSHPNFDQIEVRDQFVSEEEFVSSIVAADVVAALYRNTMRPSGIVSRCITWGIPVLARDAGWLRWAVNTFQAGWRTQPNDLDALSSALENALKSSDRFQVSAAAKAFGEFNSESNYQALWRGLVEGTDVPRPSAELLEAIR
ncbi:MAG: glycosyltransferase [Planctomycetota bacterium]